MLGKPQIPKREPINLTLDANLVAEAKALDINICRIAEESISKAIADEKARLWKIENREALQYLNDYVETHGLPLEKYRQF